MTKVKVLRNLEFLLKDIQKACKRADRISKLVDTEGFKELHSIRQEVESLILIGRNSNECSSQI